MARSQVPRLGGTTSIDSPSNHRHGMFAIDEQTMGVCREFCACRVKSVSEGVERELSDQNHNHNEEGSPNEHGAADQSGTGADHAADQVAHR
jgi:hypothetical protein